MPPTEREILEVLSEEGQAHVVDLASELDDHPATVDRKCYTLQREGAIRQTGGGVYTLTDRGDDRVSNADG